MKDMIRYGNPEVREKEIFVEDFEQALRMVSKLKAFAESHHLTWVISHWGADGWLISSETINPTGIIH